MKIRADEIRADKVFHNDVYEKFHLKYLKWCCGVHQKASNTGMWGDTGRYPLLFNALKLAIDYYDRINKLSENTLVKKSYMEQEN